MEDYRTIRGTATGEYEEKKSRFIAQLSFADSEEKAVAFLEQVRAANRTARHNVYAYRLREGNRERYSDDGEPAKTAGTPALEVLQHSGLTDLIVVITRYFGGVLLGTGGLVRAYTAAAGGALQNAELVSMRLVVDCRLRVPYAQFEQAQRIIAAAGNGSSTSAFMTGRNIWPCARIWHFSSSPSRPCYTTTRRSSKNAFPRDCPSARQRMPCK